MNDDGFMPGMLLAFIICFLFFQWVRGNIDESWRQQISDHDCAGFISTQIINVNGTGRNDLNYPHSCESRMDRIRNT